MSYSIKRHGGTYILLSEKSQSERCVMSESKHMTFWKRQNMERVKSLIVARGWGRGGGINRWTIEDFYFV